VRNQRKLLEILLQIVH